MEKRYMMNTRDLKIVELQRLLEEDEDYSLEELSKASDYKPRTLAKKLLIILISNSIRIRSTSITLF